MMSLARTGSRRWWIVLVAAGGLGCSSKLAASSGTVTVTAEASATSGAAPLKVDFSATATGGREPLTYEWDFGDGAKGVGPAVTHVYEEGGHYAAVVRVRDAAGAVGVASTPVVSVEGEQQAPPGGSTSNANAQVTVVLGGKSLEVVALAWPETGTAPLEVKFKGTSLGGKEPITYAWIFDNGETASTATATATYTEPGAYIAVFTAVDSEGAHASKDVVVVVSPETLADFVVADAGPDQFAVAGQTTVQLDGTASFDNRGRPLDYAWSFVSIPPGASMPTFHNPADSRPAFVPKVAGIYDVRLTASVPGGPAGHDMVRVTAEPAAKIEVALGDGQTGAAGSPAEPVVFLVTTPHGVPVADAEVRADFGGTKTALVSGPDGRCALRALFPEKAGLHPGSAVLVDRPAAPAPFTLTSRPAPATKLFFPLTQKTAVTDGAAGAMQVNAYFADRYDNRAPLAAATRITVALEHTAGTLAGWPRFTAAAGTVSTFAYDAAAPVSQLTFETADQVSFSVADFRPGVVLFRVWAAGELLPNFAGAEMAGALVDDDFEGADDRGATHIAYLSALGRTAPDLDGWERGVPFGGPGAAHSGTKVWGNRLSGGYPVAPSSASLLGFPVDLRGWGYGTSTLHLSFWHDYDLTWTDAATGDATVGAVKYCGVGSTKESVSGLSRVSGSSTWAESSPINYAKTDSYVRAAESIGSGCNDVDLPLPGMQESPWDGRQVYGGRTNGWTHVDVRFTMGGVEGSGRGTLAFALEQYKASSAAGAGWFIDDLLVEGRTNQPFGIFKAGKVARLTVEEIRTGTGGAECDRALEANWSVIVASVPQDRFGNPIVEDPVTVEAKVSGGVSPLVHRTYAGIPTKCQISPEHMSTCETLSKDAAIESITKSRFCEGPARKDVSPPAAAARAEIGAGSALYADRSAALSGGAVAFLASSGAPGTITWKLASPDADPLLPAITLAGNFGPALDCDGDGHANCAAIPDCDDMDPYVNAAAPLACSDLGAYDYFYYTLAKRVESGPWSYPRVAPGCAAFSLPPPPCAPTYACSSAPDALVPPMGHRSYALIDLCDAPEASTEDPCVGSGGPGGRVTYLPVKVPKIKLDEAPACASCMQIEGTGWLYAELNPIFPVLSASPWWDPPLYSAVVGILDSGAGYCQSLASQAPACASDGNYDFYGYDGLYQWAPVRARYDTTSGDKTFVLAFGVQAHAKLATYCNQGYGPTLVMTYFIHDSLVQ